MVAALDVDKYTDRAFFFCCVCVCVCVCQNSGRSFSSFFFPPRRFELLCKVDLLGFI